MKTISVRTVLIMFLVTFIVTVVVAADVCEQLNDKGRPILVTEPSSKTIVGTATLTPFQPVTNTPKFASSATPVQSTVTDSTPKPSALFTTKPAAAFIRYEYYGIRFDVPEEISITFSLPDWLSLPLVFKPVVTTRPEDYSPGTGKAGIFADQSGNITINPHSGCIYTNNRYRMLEAELMRQYVEGGTCSDVLTEHNPQEMTAAVSSLLKAKAVIRQGNRTPIQMRTTHVRVVDVQTQKKPISMNPGELAGLAGAALYGKSIVIVTSGRNLLQDPWYSSERWIFVLTPDY